MIHEQEKEFALFERSMLNKYGLKPGELEKIEMYKLACWIKEERKQKAKQLFEMLKNKKNG